MNSMKVLMILSIILIATIIIFMIKSQDAKYKRYYFMLLGLFSLFFIISGFQLTTNTDYKTAKRIQIDRIGETDSEQSKTEKHRFTNDELSTLSVDDIFSSYNDKAKERIDNVFVIDKSRENTDDENIAKNYALTLIGKVIPDTIFNDVENKEVNIGGPDRSTILILNRGKLSTEFIKSKEFKEMEFRDDVKYIILAPTESNKDLIKFRDDNEINKKWTLIGNTNNDKETPLQPDILNVVRYYFNSLGSPSYVSVCDNTISFAGSGHNPQVFSKFLEESWVKPYLYEEVIR